MAARSLGMSWPTAATPSALSTLSRIRSQGRLVSSQRKTASIFASSSRDFPREGQDLLARQRREVGVQRGGALGADEQSAE